MWIFDTDQDGNRVIANVRAFGPEREKEISRDATPTEWGGRVRFLMPLAGPMSGTWWGRRSNLANVFTYGWIGR